MREMRSEERDRKRGETHEARRQIGSEGWGIGGDRT